jgi:hypothetical protein
LIARCMLLRSNAASATPPRSDTIIERRISRFEGGFIGFYLLKCRLKTGITEHERMTQRKSNRPIECLAASFG